VTDAMSGDYDRHSDHQLHDAATHTSLVTSVAAELAPGPDGAPILLADYGCAQGRVTNVVLRAAVEQIRAAHPDVPIMVVHNDVLANDWSELFSRLRESSYLQVPGGPITPLVSATSFYEAVTPPGLVSLGVSFAAAQWLAESGPGGTGTAIYFDQLDDAARAAMAEQAHADWTTFLRHRAAELATGGRLVLTMMGRGADGVAAGHDAWGHARSVVDALIADGRLDRDRVDRFVFPVYERTVAEVERPFDEGREPQLELERCTVTDSPSPAVQYARETGDASRLAHDFVGFFRAFSEPTLRAAIDPEGSAMDELYRRLQTRLVEAADEFDFTVHVLTAVIAKVRS
jgi:SAM dependent carboxyl methyltransferase